MYSSFLTSFVLIFSLLKFNFYILSILYPIYISNSLMFSYFNRKAIGLKVFVNYSFYNVKKHTFLRDYNNGAFIIQIIFSSLVAVLNVRINWVERRVFVGNRSLVWASYTSPCWSCWSLWRVWRARWTTLCQSSVKRSVAWSSIWPSSRPQSALLARIRWVGMAGLLSVDGGRRYLVVPLCM